MSEPDYLEAFTFLVPETTKISSPAASSDVKSVAVLNSCSQSGVPATQQCSGHGWCKPFNENKRALNYLSFCICDRDWTDPECRTKRKSQTVTFLLSLFLGPLGADYFYLGLPLWGLTKMLTLGGCGVWWVYDIVRTGSTPVYGQTYRVANDLPYGIFVITTVSLFLFIGFVISVRWYLSVRQQRRDDLATLHESEEAKHFKLGEENLGVKFADSAGGFADGRRQFAGYGSTLLSNVPNAGEPYASTGGPYGPYRWVRTTCEI